MFNHEKLNVYQRTLSFNAKVVNWVEKWDNRHAICDHLPRAAESILENIAMGCAAGSAMKMRSLDYAIGSTLECAACLDIAGVKRLPDHSLVLNEKEELSQILKMLMGLKRSWATAIREVREEAAEYGAGLEMTTDENMGDEVSDRVSDEVSDRVSDEVFRRALFHHEKLDVYRVAIEAGKAFSSSEAVSRLSVTVFRRLDVLMTSMILNIAEGNGRFSDADHQRFVGTAHEAAIKMAARLDLCAIQGILPSDEVAGWKKLLSRVTVMTYAMRGDGQL